MKKLILFLAFLQLATFGQAQTAEQVIKEIQDKKIIEKVEKHDKLVEQLEWTSPKILAPTLVAIAGLCYTLWLYFFGIGKKANEVMRSDEMKSQMEKLMTESLQAEEKRVKAKPFFLLFGPGKEMRDLPKYLMDAGFKGVIPKTLSDSIDPDTNQLVVFNNEDSEMLDKIVQYVLDNEKVRTKARFFYFGSQRFEDKTVKMTNSANFRDALVARLYESLKAID